MSRQSFFGQVEVLFRDKAKFRARRWLFLFSRLKGENREKINNREEMAEVAGVQRDAAPSSRRGAPRPGAYEHRGARIRSSSPDGRVDRIERDWERMREQTHQQ